MNAAAFCYGFRVVGDCRQPRRVIVADEAMAAYAACDALCEVERESYLSAFRFAADFRQHVEPTGSTARFQGPCWADCIWWDVDTAGAIDQALEPARRLVTALVDWVQIPEDEILAFLSGSKGFHVGIPTGLWGPPPGPSFHAVARRFAAEIAAQAGVATDGAVYDKVRCWRAPNSRHPKTGLHKRHLTTNQLMHMRIDAIVELAASPAPFELPTATAPSEHARSLWAGAAEHVRREAEAHAARQPVGNASGQLNRSTLEFIRNGAQQGERHTRLYSAAANLAEHGAPENLCVALLRDVALDAGLPPAEVQRVISDARRSVQRGASAAQTAGVCHTLPPTLPAANAGGGEGR